MAEFILLMHDDGREPAPDAMWEAYFRTLRERGGFDGGSSIGPGRAFRKTGIPGPASDHLTGFIRITADNLTTAQGYLAGNPTYECGGTVEIRELPRD